jgi:hypothetical protein
MGRLWNTPGRLCGGTTYVLASCSSGPGHLAVVDIKVGHGPHDRWRDGTDQHTIGPSPCHEGVGCPDLKKDDVGLRSRHVDAPGGRLCQLPRQRCGPGMVLCEAVDIVL